MFECFEIYAHEVEKVAESVSSAGHLTWAKDLRMSILQEWHRTARTAIHSHALRPADRFCMSKSGMVRCLVYTVLSGDSLKLTEDLAQNLNLSGGCFLDNEITLERLKVTPGDLSRWSCVFPNIMPFSTYNAIMGRCAKAKLTHVSDFRNSCVKEIEMRDYVGSGMACFLNNVLTHYSEIDQQCADHTLCVP